mmetsp:Transcript_22092/g.50515  ORF Transcript_22092/g.50515 Transcript_22092/m.50515 type:complete len:208 (+) Transcript_22092:1047-1670(+)
MSTWKCRRTLSRGNHLWRQQGRMMSCMPLLSMPVASCPLGWPGIPACKMETFPFMTCSSFVSTSLRTSSNSARFAVSLVAFAIRPCLPRANRSSHPHAVGDRRSCGERRGALKAAKRVRCAFSHSSNSRAACAYFCTAHSLSQPVPTFEHSHSLCVLFLHSPTESHTLYSHTPCPCPRTAQRHPCAFLTVSDTVSFSRTASHRRGRR